MSINSVVNDTVTGESVVNALKPKPPTISGYSISGFDDTALDPAGGQTVQINGTGFLAGATITFDGSAVAVVTYVNPNRLTFTSPAKTAGTYTIYVVNADGGTAIFIPGIIYSVLPTWTTGAGTLGSYYETQSIANTVVASGDAPVTYSLFSGSLPTGATLAANGVITGTAPVDSSSTTYSFTIEAIDAQLQGSTRSFSLTINVDAVTWVSPANATTYTSTANSAISNVALSATDAAGYAVSYSANALPTGLSLSGANISGTPTVIADSSTLLTATAATTNRTAVRTINWSITVANDPYFEYNTLLIPGASTTFVDDASTNNFAVTINGDTKPNNNNPYTPGYYSNYFDGSGDGLNVPASSALAPLTGDFTYEAWVYPTSSSVTYRVVFGIDNYAGGQPFRLYQYGTQFQYWYTGSATDFIGSSTITMNTWYHLAITRSSGVLKLFVNGTQAGSNVTSTLNYPSSIFRIGIDSNGTYPFVGYVSNLRAVKGAAVYTANFTPSTTPLTAIANTSLLTCQSNRFIDNSTNNFTLTVFGDTKIQSFQPFTPNSSYSTYGSGYFDGTGDTITYTDSNNNLDLGGIVASLEMWVYPTAATNYSHVFGKYGSTWGWSTSNGIEYAIAYQPAGFYLVYNNAGNAAFVTDPTARSINQWYHVAVASDASNNLSLFINGTRVATTTATITKPTTRTSIIQGANSNGSETFAGYITDTRFISGTGAYSASSSTITVPAVPLTAITNTQLLTLQNNQSTNNNVFLDNSTNNFFVTRNGNTTQGTFSPYGGNWSNYFATSSDYLTYNPGASAAFGTDNFTVEAWVFATSALSSGDNPYICDTRGGGGVWSLSWNYAGGANPWQLAWGNSSYLQSTTSMVINQWNHCAYVRSGTTGTLYLNGVSIGTWTDSYNYSQSVTSLIIARRYALTGGTQYLPGYLSNFRVVKGTAVYTANFTPSTTPLTAISGTSLLTCQSNRFIDNSTNALALTISGTPTIQRFSPFNPASVTPASYGAYFDGTGDYLTVPSNSAFAMGTGDFTIECWVNTPLVHAYNDVIIELRSTESTSTGFVFNMNPTGIGYQLNFYTAGGFNLGSTVLNYNVWNHCAVTRSGTTVRLFSNGVLNGTFTKANNFSDTPVPHIGVSPLYSPSDVIGYFSNLRVIKGTALYTTTFTPSTTPLTTTSQGATASQVSLLTCQSPTFIDNSTNNFTITAVGNSQPTQQNPFGYTSATTNGYTVSTTGGSGYFDGTGDYLTVDHSTAFNLSGIAFTIEVWVYTITSSGYRNILTKRPASAGPSYQIWINNTDNKIGIGNATTPQYSNSQIATNTWNHVAWTYDGSATSKMWINGVLDTTVTLSPSADNANPITIGAWGLNGSEYFNGYITDVRIVKGSQVYTTAFIPPATPLTALQNTTLLNNITSAGVYDAAMMNNMETIGDAKLSTAVSKFGGSSMSFDGTSDYLSTYNPSYSLSVGSGDFTYECWLYVNSLPGTVTAVYHLKNDAALATTVFVLEITPTGAISISTGLAIIANGTSGKITTGSWIHFAFVRTSGVFKTFFNGTQDISTSNTTTYNGTYLQIGAFRYTAYDFSLNGYIDDLRITRGVARYTANFTPPTEAFQTK